MTDRLYKLLCDENICVKCDEDLSKHVTFRLGGKADLFAEPANEKELLSVLSLADECGVPHYILGKGSNLLVPDEGYRGLIVHLGENFSGIELVDDTTVKCLAGTDLVKVCLFALEHSLTGLEFAYGIPGSAGGAAYMNAGAYGGEMKDVLTSCTHIDSNLKSGEFSGEQLDLSYRHSAYSGGDFVITSLTLKLSTGDKAQIKAKMDDLMSRRKSKQPLEYPSAGSTFKRPEGYFAGKLIQDSGLKGFSVGGAQVSEKHSGFVINKGGATCKDVLTLCDIVSKTVMEKFSVTLEREVKILGN